MANGKLPARIRERRDRPKNLCSTPILFGGTFHPASSCFEQFIHLIFYHPHMSQAFHIFISCFLFAKIKCPTTAEKLSTFISSYNNMIRTLQEMGSSFGVLCHSPITTTARSRIEELPPCHPSLAGTKQLDCIWQHKSGGNTYIKVPSQLHS